MIRDDFVVEAKSFEYFGEEQGSDSGSIDGFLGRAENYPLSKPMVDHDQKGIEAIQKEEVSDQIAGDLLKGAGARGWNRKEGRLGQMHVHLVLLARSTAADVVVDIGGKAQPPELRCNQLTSFENTGMSCSVVVMVASNDRMAKVISGQDIYATLVS